MTVQETIERKVREALAPDHLEVINESSMHRVPPGSESHFRIRVVSAGFEGQTRVRRHQTIYRLLAKEMEGPVHALGLETFTPAEWTGAGGGGSPPCMGGDRQGR